MNLPRSPDTKTFGLCKLFRTVPAPRAWKRNALKNSADFYHLDLAYDRFTCNLKIMLVDRENRLQK